MKVSLTCKIFGSNCSIKILLFWDMVPSHHSIKPQMIILVILLILHCVNHKYCTWQCIGSYFALTLRHTQLKPIQGCSQRKLLQLLESHHRHKWCTSQHIPPAKNSLRGCLITLSDSCTLPPDLNIWCLRALFNGPKICK
jgi:hypothetical protein